MSNYYYSFTDEAGKTYYLNTVTGVRKYKLSATDIEVSEIDDCED